jgi:ribose-phosphate pyrophosphokinase
MKILNLVKPDTSDIKFEVSRFPDGQQQVTIEPSEFPEMEDIEVIIKARLNNWIDLEKIICANQSLKELGVEDVHLYVPYVVGARSDRQFEEGSNNYLKHVICPVINSQEFKSVTVLDPHSDCLEMGIEGFKKLPNYSTGLIDGQNLIGFALNNIYSPICNVNAGRFILISPDAGASKKVYKVAEALGYKESIITCTKDRGKDGRLTKTNVPMQIEVYNDKDFIIIDDICDGGATFINIAKEVRRLYPDKTNKIYLIVTHGIFSKGFETLEEYFDGIYSTNSYRTITPATGHGANIVKQLDVF